MLVIRYNRTGRRNQPFFRLVVQEKTAAPSGRHSEVVGSWDPHAKKAVLKTDRIQHWLSVGAQPSDSVYNLLVSQGVIEGKKRVVKMPKKTKDQQPTTDDGDKKEETAEGEKTEKSQSEELETQKSEESKEGEEKPEEVKTEEKPVGEEKKGPRKDEDVHAAQEEKVVEKKES